MRSTFVRLSLLICFTIPVASMYAGGQVKASRVAQVVALDECDPITFNAALGTDFCRNVALGALGFSTTLQDLFSKAAAGKPDPGWILSRTNYRSRRELSWR